MSRTRFVPAAVALGLALVVAVPSAGVAARPYAWARITCTRAVLVVVTFVSSEAVDVGYGMTITGPAFGIGTSAPSTSGPRLDMTRLPRSGSTILAGRYVVEMRVGDVIVADAATCPALPPAQG